MYFHTKALSKLVVLLFIPSVSYYSIWSKQNLKIFNIAGSSSAQNIFNSLLQGEGEYSVAIANTGSAIGLEHLENGRSDFALVSYDIKDWLEAESRKSKYKSLKLAEESIVVAYKRPEGCDKELEITQDNVKDFFALFFGHKQDSQSIKTDLKNLISGDNANECSVKLTSLVKSSGPSKSGTVKSLFSLSLLSNNNNDDWINKIKQGYGTDSGLVFIQESGLMHAEHFLKNVKDGWITYLPSSFVEKNWTILESKGVKFAKVKFDSSSVEFKKEEKESGNYKWTRPFNLVYSIDGLTEEKKSFVQKVVGNLSKLKDIHLKNNESLDNNSLFTSNQ